MPAKPVTLGAVKTAATKMKRELVKADGDKDSQLSVAEVTTYGKSLNDGFKVGRALTTMTRFALHSANGASSISVAGAKQAVDRAVNLIGTRDKNGDGILSAGSELDSARQLKTYQALAALSARLSLGGTGGTLTAQQLGAAIAPLKKDANFISESDYAPKFVSASVAAGPLTPESAVKALEPQIAKFYDSNYSGFAYVGFSPTETKDFFERLTEAVAGAEPAEVKSAAAFTSIKQLLDQNLTDLQVFRYGPSEPGSDKLATDRGLYVFGVVGKAKDGKVCGVLIGSVET